MRRVLLATAASLIGLGGAAGARPFGYRSFAEELPGRDIGVAEATTDLAVSYAGTREQFKKPIGQFQAVKHMCADSFVRQELARGAVYGAAATLEHPEVGDPVRAASGAKINAGEAAMRNARTCIQVHGGMGFTWEIPAHFYLKRAWVLENSFGTQDEHSDLLG